MENYEIKKHIENFNSKYKQYHNSLNIDALNEKVKDLDAKMLENGFWDDKNSAQAVINELNLVKDKLNAFNKFESLHEEITLYNEMYQEDNSLKDDLVSSINELLVYVDEFEIKILLSGEYDSSNAILEIHPGAGGTESQDWAEMLFRMYNRWATKHNFKFDIIDYQNGDEAGIKSVTVSLKGINVYGLLKSERGIHRLVRISPFDSNSKRHTSFASVDVMPEVENDNSIEIKPEDIKVDTYRSSGAGGQSVNTTDSAVRITHLKTNTVVTCQNERSQIKNREIAMNVLKSKLIELKIKEHEEELAKLKGDQKSIGWGSQIRSYVFHPYSMVKDLRTSYETGNTQSVMDGNIDEFIYSYLRNSVKENNDE